jgi:initiation factor 1A
MPNQKGGKNYKKSKHGTGSEGPRLEEAGPEEMYGRIIKILGNLNMNVYCNDNVVRICKVRGALRKRVWIVTGDLVIISLRNFEAEDNKKYMTAQELRLIDRGDIVHKIDASLHSKAKKLEGINPKLFMALENADGKVLGELGNRKDEDYDEKNDGIVFEGSQDGSGDEREGESNEDSEEEEVAAGAKKKAGKAKESKFAKPSADDDDDVNVDDI